jgi:hypothetical protein
MNGADLLPTAMLVALAAVIIAVIWLIGTNRRAAAAVARDTSYREILQRWSRWSWPLPQ